MNKLDAFKMDGLGNDFIIFDKRKKSISLTENEIIKISDRNNIGCDQVIFIDNDKNNDAYVTFFNSDGGEIAACGNGSRCVAYFLMKEKSIKKTLLRTKAGILHAELKNDLVSVNIGKPNFNWKTIPLFKEIDNKNLKIKVKDNDGKEIEGGFSLSVGNPHIIFFVNNLDNFNLKEIGPNIENHNYFPEKCNVTFAKIVNKKHIIIKVWERGAGLTKACGTAACATAVAAATLKLSDRLVDIEFNEGRLSINWNSDDNIYMAGKVSDIKKIVVNI
ncbi:diaminopimelate epimerase [Pelagibacteraceae bacterium]|nr:diaminopimelate epimerase [Pelagibacteraceae bacterium]